MTARMIAYGSFASHSVTRQSFREWRRRGPRISARTMLRQFPALRLLAVGSEHPDSEAGVNAAA